MRAAQLELVPSSSYRGRVSRTGRPPTYDVATVAALVDQLGSVTRAAEQLGCPRGTVYRVLRRLPVDDPRRPAEQPRPVDVPLPEPEPGAPLTRRERRALSTLVVDDVEPDDGRVRVRPGQLLELSLQLRTARVAVEQGDAAAARQLLARATRTAQLLGSLPTG